MKDDTMGQHKAGKDTADFGLGFLLAFYQRIFYIVAVKPSQYSAANSFIVKSRSEKRNRAAYYLLEHSSRDNLFYHCKKK